MQSIQESAGGDLAKSSSFLFVIFTPCPNLFDSCVSNALMLFNSLSCQHKAAHVTYCFMLLLPIHILPICWNKARVLIAGHNRPPLITHLSDICKCFVLVMSSTSILHCMVDLMDMLACYAVDMFQVLNYITAFLAATEHLLKELHWFKFFIWRV